jgi:MOSC domain-containing protein YiiM
MTGTPGRSLAELQAALPDILAAPKAEGRLDLIVVRPATGQRRTPARVALSAAGGVAGDHWAAGCWRVTEEGRPHPDVQVCLMMSRCIRAIAGPVEAWAAAGDNLFLDMDLTPANAPPGTRLALGTAVLEITKEPHTGCGSFVDRYGRDACIFVNTGPGKVHRLRGIYARVLRDGEVAVGDAVTRIARPAKEASCA